MGRWHVLREPTVLILLLASVVHVVRRNVFDFLLFFGTAVVIIVESRMESRRFEQRGTGTLAPATPLSYRRRWWSAAVIALLSAAIALLPIAGGLMRVVLIGSGVAVLVLVVARPAPPPGGAGRARGWQLWTAVGVAACLWELTSFIAQQVWPADQNAHPAVSDLVGPLLTTWVGRAVFLLLWVSAGWWLLRQLLASGGGTRTESGATGPSATPVIVTDDGAAGPRGPAGVDHGAPGAGGRTEAGR